MKKKRRKKNFGKKFGGEKVKKEISRISVVDYLTDEVLKDGFHDEFDALEWLLEKHKKSGKFIIKSERVIIVE